MQNNLLLDILFWLHNNLNMIIKLYITDYLPLAVLFPSVFGSTNFKILSIIRQKYTVSFQFPFLGNNYTFNNVFNFLNLYNSDWKVLYSLIGPGNRNLIHVDIIFATPKIGFSKRYVSANSAFC